MKKDIFEPVVKDELVNRVNCLTENSKAGWGVMNVAEMMHHCSDGLKNLLVAHTSGKPESLKQKILRFLFLYIVPRYPKNAKTFPHLDIKKNNIAAGIFEKEKQELIANLNNFQQYKGQINFLHPNFGYMNRKQWGIMTWMHLDHHLRQFGV